MHQPSCRSDHQGSNHKTSNAPLDDPPRSRQGEQLKGERRQSKYGSRHQRQTNQDSQGYARGIVIPHHLMILPSVGKSEITVRSSRRRSHGRSPRIPMSEPNPGAGRFRKVSSGSHPELKKLAFPLVPPRGLELSRLFRDPRQPAQDSPVPKMTQSVPLL